MRTNTPAVLLTLTLGFVASGASAASLRSEPVGSPHPLARQVPSGPSELEAYQEQLTTALVDVAQQFPHPRGAPPVHKLGTVDLTAKKAGMMAHKKIDKKAKAERKAKAGKEKEKKDDDDEEPEPKPDAADVATDDESTATAEAEAPVVAAEPVEAPAAEAPATVEAPTTVVAAPAAEPAAPAAPSLPDLASLLAPAKRLTPNNFPSNPPQPDAADMPPAPFADRPAPDADPATQAAYYFGKLEELKDVKPPAPPALPQKRGKKQGKKGEDEPAVEDEAVVVEPEAEAEQPVVAAAPAAEAPIAAEAPVEAAAPPYPSPEEVQQAFEGAIANLQTLQPTTITPAGTKRAALIKELRERGLKLDDGVEAAKRQVEEALAYLAKSGRSIVAGDMLGSLAGDRRIISPPISLFSGSDKVARATVVELQEGLKKLGDELNKVALDPSNLSPAPRMYNHKVKPRATPFIG